MKNPVKAIAAIGLFLCFASAAEAAEYYIYRGADHRVVLTNNKPPESAKAVLTYHLIDATGEEIAATEKATRKQPG